MDAVAAPPRKAIPDPSASPFALSPPPANDGSVALASRHWEKLAPGAEGDGKSSLKAAADAEASGEAAAENALGVAVGDIGGSG
jgi:hypothetical protein